MIRFAFIHTLLLALPATGVPSATQVAEDSIDTWSPTASHVAQNDISSANFSAQTSPQAFCRIANLDSKFSNETVEANLPEGDCKQAPTPESHNLLLNEVRLSQETISVRWRLS